MGLTHRFTASDPHVYSAPQTFVNTVFQPAAPALSIAPAFSYGYGAWTADLTLTAQPAVNFGLGGAAYGGGLFVLEIGQNDTCNFNGAYVGVSGCVRHNGTGALGQAGNDRAVGVYGQVVGNNINSIYRAWAVYAQVSGSTSQVNSMAGLMVDSNTGNPGQVVNNYGIQVQDQAITGANNYAIKTGLGQVSLGDVLTINGGANVAGSISFNAVNGLTIQGKNGSGNAMTIFNAAGTAALFYNAVGQNFPIAPNGIQVQNGESVLNHYQEGTFTPGFTGLTVVNGTGGASFTGRYTRIGNRVDWEVFIQVSGTATTSSTAGTTFVNNLPFTAAVGSGLIANDASASTSLGTGLIPGGTVDAFPPSWAALNHNIALSGTIFL